MSRGMVTFWPNSSLHVINPFWWICEESLFAITPNLRLLLIGFRHAELCLACMHVNMMINAIFLLWNFPNVDYGMNMDGFALLSFSPLAMNSCLPWQSCPGAHVFWISGYPPFNMYLVPWVLSTQLCHSNVYYSWQMFITPGIIVIAVQFQTVCTQAILVS